MLWLLCLALTSRRGGKKESVFLSPFSSKEVFDNLKLVVYEVNSSFRATLKFLGECNVRSVFKMFGQVILLKEKRGGGLRRTIQISWHRMNPACRARLLVGYLGRQVLNLCLNESKTKGFCFNYVSVYLWLSVLLRNACTAEPGTLTCIE